ncbi:hypothetical protein BUALT_Bualt07G0022900 [Buddleja alternifolia]|uniref:MULE transposase domain-containing protein n=1 Tax=Buddleja alternifolia TaxID=168488 RepID=A0AAV6XI60_9LAMI|nr:hypothetical protein BUALT_Bualt07G0022900 [Buddleja alternifolia]
MSTDENFENNEDDDFENEYLDFAEDLNWKNETVENLNNEHEVVENLNNELEVFENLNNEPKASENLNNEGENEAAKNLKNAENVNTEFQERVETSINEEGENVEGVDAAVSEGVHPQEVEQPAGNVGNQVDPNIESESDASSVSDCPSWMCEDLEEQQEEQFYERNFNNETENWCSDVNDDDELRSLRGSDNDNEVYEVWNDDMERRKVDLFAGLKFETRKQYKEVLKAWVVRKGWDVIFLRSEKRKVTVICKNGYEWRIHASPIMGSITFQIKSIKGQHFYNFRTDNKQATYKNIGKRIQHFINDNPNEGLVSLKNKIRRDVQIEYSLHKVYRAKRYAVELLRGDLKEQYNRPMLGLDRCFLKGLFKGQLLCAVGRDRNDNLYLIAWALVEVEKFDTWKWFLDLLMRDIGSSKEKVWTFLSDRQKRLIHVVHSVAPRAEHRFCVRHLYNNFKGMFKDEELKKLFWKVASTYSVKQHLRIMKQIERLHPKRGAQQTPYKWMSEIPAQHWSRYCFPSRTKCEVVVNNIMSGMLDYEDSGLGVVDPPHVRIMPRRLKKVRRRDANDIRGQTNVSRKGLTHTCSICGEQGHNKNGHNKRARQTRQTATNDGPAQTETEVVHIPPYASQMPSQFVAEDSNEVPPSSSQTRTPNEMIPQSAIEDSTTLPPAEQVPPQRRRKAASQQPRRQTTSTIGNQVVYQGPITAPQASHNSKFQSSQFFTQFSESSHGPIQKKKGHQIPTGSKLTQIPQQLQRHTPKSRKQAIPVSLSSRKIQKMRHVLNPIPNPSNFALKRPAVFSSVQSMLKQIYASYNSKVNFAQPSSMPGPTSTSMPTTSKSDTIGTVETPKKK